MIQKVHIANIVMLYLQDGIKKVQSEKRQLEKVLMLITILVVMAAVSKSIRVSSFDKIVFQGKKCFAQKSIEYGERDEETKNVIIRNNDKII